MISQQTYNYFNISEPLRIGFVGVGDQGSWHLDVALGIPGIEVPALCDVDDHYLYRAKRWVEESGRPAPRLYNRSKTDFRRLCQNEELDLVVCATSWKWHVPVLLEAMRNEINAVSEVPICLTLDEAWELIETYEKTGYWGTLGFKNVHNSITNMIYKDLFGEIIHFESGYIHDLRLVKNDPEREPWRLHHSVVRNGNLYPDHPTARAIPFLNINHGDRFDYLVSMSSASGTLSDYIAHYYGEKHPLATTNMKQGDYNATLLKTVNGKLYTLNFDTNTPHPRGITRLQGSKGVFISGRGVGQKIYLEGKTGENHQWSDADELLSEYEHPDVKNYHPPEREDLRGHSGGRTTPYRWYRLVKALTEGTITDFDVIDSVTSSAISALTEESVRKGGEPIDFPDFTRGQWEKRPPFEETYNSS